MSDVFRKRYRELSDNEKFRLDRIKGAAEILWALIDTSDLPDADQRAAALAKTKLEEAVMWSVKSVTG